MIFSICQMQTFILTNDRSGGKAADATGELTYDEIESRGRRQSGNLARAHRDGGTGCWPDFDGIGGECPKCG